MYSACDIIQVINCFIIFDKSSNCHINWLAHAGRSILVTKFRADWSGNKNGKFPISSKFSD